MTEQYLGDGVYAEMEDGLIKLTTRPAPGSKNKVDNTIYLNPDVWEDLKQFEQFA